MTKHKGRSVKLNKSKNSVELLVLRKNLYGAQQKVVCSKKTALITAVWKYYNKNGSYSNNIIRLVFN